MCGERESGVGSGCSVTVGDWGGGQAVVGLGVVVGVWAWPFGCIPATSLLGVSSQLLYLSKCYMVIDSMNS